MGSGTCSHSHIKKVQGTTATKITNTTYTQLHNVGEKTTGCTTKRTLWIWALLDRSTVVQHPSIYLPACYETRRPPLILILCQTNPVTAPKSYQRSSLIIIQSIYVLGFPTYICAPFPTISATCSANLVFLDFVLQSTRSRLPTHHLPKVSLQITNKFGN
jgi:hypothetical protein